MIVTLAGRRIDAPDAGRHSAKPRFPAANVRLVGQRIRLLFERQQATALVCAAACGADILALEEAGELGIRRRIVLPFSRAQFRASSVTDRGGDWGERFDRILDDVEHKEELVVLGYRRDDPKAYTGANLAILDEADGVGRELHRSVLAAVVWDGRPRDDEDVTQHFLREAGKRFFPVIEISTIAP